MTEFFKAAGFIRSDLDDPQNGYRLPITLISLLMLLSGAVLVFSEQLMQFEQTKPALGGIMLISAAYILFIGLRAKASSAERAEFDATGEAVEDAAMNLADTKPATHNFRHQDLHGELAFTDKATGLGNKRRLQEKFNTLAARHDAGKGEGFAVGVVNLDGMKPINDLFGRDGGDRLIEQCSMRLRSAVEPFGFVFRYDGDEYAFILPNVSTEEEVTRIGGLLHEVLIAPFDIDGRAVRISGSFGFALFPETGDTFPKVTDCIETALYHSKRKGRGRITVYSSEIEKAVRDNALIEQALRRAIADDNIAPHYQPIISLQDGRLLGFEALARWIDPELGFVSPAKFIPLAEERGIIAPLTEVLLYKSASTAAEWPDELFLSFNLSSTQLVDPSTAETILRTIERAGLPPQRLEIEVTETAMMSDPETAAQIINELHDHGVRISMDDFGTGQSSLGRLRELKLDKVKIDRAFIMAIGEDKPAEHIVRAILEMCTGLDLMVVAEGIEEINQAESLKGFGCHAGQGYLFGKPQDANRTMGYIHEFNRIASSDRATKTA